MIEARGFVFENHEVQTEDGYILSMHRLFSPTEDKNETRPVVFMQHGLSESSETFVMKGDQAIAYRFAGLGYDVWLGNNRGGIYS